MSRHALVAGALLLVAMPAGAQVLAMNTPRVPASAIELEARARALHDSRPHYREAASLYVEAARLRDRADARVIENRRMAAHLFHYVGDDARAQAVMETAAEAALDVGDIVTAANSLLDAAWLAYHQSRRADVLRLADRAELLMASPLVDDATRAQVLQRIVRKKGAVSVRRALP